jgi:hypothetical protein
MVATVFHVITEIRRQGVTVLMVEQNAARALRIADRAYVMWSGCIALSGRAADLLGNVEVRRAYLGGSLSLAEPYRGGERFHVFGVATDGVEEEVVCAEGDQLVQSLPDLLGRAVDAGGVGTGRVAIDDGEPAVELFACHFRAFVHGHEHTL